MSSMTISRNATQSVGAASRPRPILESDGHGDVDADLVASREVAAALKQLKDTLAPQRRVVRAGEVIYQAGARFDNLFVMNSGFFKLVTLTADGREQVVSLKFRGDWLASTASRPDAMPATPWRWTPATSGSSAMQPCWPRARPIRPC